ncbi:MAG: PulJ/GspJ family protein [Bdellovibrionota bacterium]
MNNKNFKTQSGFTFVEMILAISILAIMFTIAQSVVIQMIRGKKTLDEIRETDLILNNITNRLNREFSLVQKESLPLDLECNSNTITEGFKIFLCGETSKKKEFRHDTISFMSRKAKQYLRGKYISKSKRVSDLVYIKYRVEKGEKEQKGKNDNSTTENYWLIRDEIPVMNKELQNDYRMTFPVIKNISEFKIKYYDKEEDTWQDSWYARDKLPDLIEFKIKIPSKNNEEKLYQITSVVSF